MAEPRPITAKQEEVLELMRNGWELRKVAYGQWWIVCECGAGSVEMRRVNANTARGLDSRHLIEVNNRGFPTATYKITERK